MTHWTVRQLAWEAGLGGTHYYLRNPLRGNKGQKIEWEGKMDNPENLRGIEEAIKEKLGRTIYCG